jgi:hypothetical protein
MQLLDASTVGYVVIAFAPNLLIMLWAMARMHRDLRVVTAKLDIVESDNRMLDEGLKALGHELRELRERPPAQEHPLPRSATGG